MNNELLLLCGNDIPFPEAQLTIHQPSIKEIGYIGEEAFFVGCELLNFSKKNLESSDKNDLINSSDFDIIMSIMKDKKNIAIQKNRISAMLLLSLLFPDYKMIIRESDLAFEKDKNSYYINNNNYPRFKEILNDMFCLKANKSDEQNYNPAGEQARKIAEKLRKGRSQVAKVKGENEKVSIISRYMSILCVGLPANLNDLKELTIYQLFDAFGRYELKMNYDIYFKAKLAGAKDLEEVENWMKDIHSDSK
jgi:hypothetical protein